MISVPSDYLGNLESDDFETTEFEIKVSSSFSGKSLPLNVRVSYADSFNEVLEDTLTVDMKMYSADELAELGIKSTAQEETSLTLLLLVAPIGILVLSFWLFMLVDACTARFKKKTFKVMWVVLLLVTHIFGAIVYFFVRNRFKVLEEYDQWVAGLCFLAVNSFPFHLFFNLRDNCVYPAYLSEFQAVNELF